MSGPLNAFKVVTEFKYDVGHALLGTKTLTDGVQGLQNAVDGVQFSLARMAMGFAFQSNGLASFIGLLGVASSNADSFQKKQLDWANTMSANKDKLTGPIDSFNQKMQFSSQLLEDITRQANEFGLPAEVLAKSANTLANQLVPKGLAGDNMKTAIDISRNLLKSAPSLGLDASMVEGQLLRMVEGGASQGDPLFLRLLGETSAFGDLKKGGAPNATKLFNTMPIEKRLDMIYKGLQQFASDPENLKARAGSLGQQVQLFRGLMGGDALQSIFRPLGDSINKVLAQILAQVNGMLMTKGKALVGEVTRFVDMFLAAPERLVTNLLMLRDLMKNLKAVEAATALTALGTAFGAILSWLGVITPAMFGFLRVGIPMVAVFAEFASRVLPVLGPVIKGLGVLAGLAALAFMFPGAAAIVVGAIGMILQPLLIMGAVFTLFSKAAAIANIRDAKMIPELTVRFANLVNKVMFVGGIIAEIFNTIFESLASIIAPAFMFGNFLSLMHSVVDELVTTLAAAVIGIQAIGVGIGSLMGRIVTGQFENLAENVINDMSEAIQKQEADFFGLKNNTTNSTVKNQVTMNVNMNNSFKEMLEPDRVAFTIKDQLLKAATNRTQGRNGTFSYGARSQGKD